MTQHTNSQNLTERLEKLERQARRLRLVVAALALSGCAVALMGQASSTRTVRANRIVVTDAQGRDRVRIEVTADGPQMTFLNADGARIAQLADESGGVTFFLGHIDPEKRFSSSIFLSALIGNAGLGLVGGNEGVVSAGAGKGGGELMVGNSDPENKVLVTASGDGPGVDLTSRTNRAALKATGNGPSLDLSDEDGFSATLGHSALVTTRTGEKHETSAASIVLFGKDKKMLWSAP